MRGSGLCASQVFAYADTNTEATFRLCRRNYDTLVDDNTAMALVGCCLGVLDTSSRLEIPVSHATPIHQLGGTLNMIHEIIAAVLIWLALSVPPTRVQQLEMGVLVWRFEQGEAGRLDCRRLQYVEGLVTPNPDRSLYAR